MKESIYKSYDELPRVVASSVSFAPPQAARLSHSAAPPFPSLKIGSRIVVPKERFIRWVEQNTGGAV